MKLLTLAGLALAAGCGGGELTQLDGIYEITSWTENESGCDSAGASVLEERDNAHFIVTEEEFFGVEFVQVAPCTDLEACRGQTSGALSLIGYGFDQGSDDDGWRGEGGSAGENLDTPDCFGEARDFTLESIGADAVEVDIIVTAVDGFPKGDEDACWTDDARAAAEGQPCTGRETFAGMLVEAL